MNMGIIGAGMIVHDLFNFIDQIPSITVQALCSKPSHQQKLDKLREEHAITSIYTDYQALLNDPKVDTIYIGLPNHLHFTYTKLALESGKNVICEKPFTATLEEFTVLKTRALEKQLILLEAISNQYAKQYQLIRDSLSEVGTVKIVECNYSQYSSRYSDFQKGIVHSVFDPAKAGGALMDINIYNIHFTIGLFGAPKQVTYMPNIEKGIDTSGILLLDYNSFKCVCIGAKDSTSPNHISIQGDKGSIHLSGSSNDITNFELTSLSRQAIMSSLNYPPHRMYDEFVAFNEIINRNDLDKAFAMLEHSEKVMQVIDSAQKQMLEH
ncbi:Gfo/Idh/MocA family protein [Terribacillus sp. DMT04]|uniref:Gfo/Idh/MocA family protein n=1 Tax=Terribacillus sp. DMT04 TaxID=2850441 RepID=UPI001C2BB179|nr:Gfo/Idh/MocA family oxidoreductase [Terribacillus sp. DMT04]QXE03253.1 Gfo/Idh/MocA family oxidoreductase [Terribacillus sp. DMT04]